MSPVTRTIGDQVLSNGREIDGGLHLRELKSGSQIALHCQRLAFLYKIMPADLKSLMLKIKM